MWISSFLISKGRYKGSASECNLNRPSTNRASWSSEAGKLFLAEQKNLKRVSENFEVRNIIFMVGIGLTSFTTDGIQPDQIKHELSRFVWFRLDHDPKRLIWSDTKTHRMHPRRRSFLSKFKLKKRKEKKSHSLFSFSSSWLSRRLQTRWCWLFSSWCFSPWIHTAERRHTHTHRCINILED